MATVTSGYYARGKKQYIDADANSQLDYSFDWAAWLAAQADTIVAAEFILDPLLAPAVTSVFDATTATVWITPGANVVTGTAYPVTCRITTDNSPPRIEDQTIYLNIVER